MNHPSFHTPLDLYPNPPVYTRVQAQSILERIVDGRARHEPLSACLMCGKRGRGWLHPDPECQAYFEELASEWCLAKGQEVDAAVCSRGCWEEFVTTSQGEPRLLEFDGTYEDWR